MKKKRLKLKKSVIKKSIILIIFSIILTFLFYITFYIYTNIRKINKYTKTTNEYSYLEIVKMSDEFAQLENKTFHFVKDKYNTLYIIAINSQEKNKYKKIIEYSYGKIDKSKPIKVYGLPVKSNKEIKKIAIKYINKFLSYNEQIPITLKNYSDYLPLTFLDTTITEKYEFNYVVFLLFLIFGIIFLILIKILFL